MASNTNLPERLASVPSYGGWEADRQLSLRKLKAFVTVLTASVVVIAFGTFGYMLVEGVSAFDALYMTVITVTTIGYGEVFELSQAGRLFTMILAFLGVGIIFVTASEVARVVLEGDIRRLMGIPRGGSMIKKIENHIVVCGYGRMGRAVVDVLESEGAAYVVVDTDIEKCRALVDDNRLVIQGDATQEEVLLAAGLNRAVTFIACLADDAHNVYAILLARQIREDITIIARAVDEAAGSRLRLAGAHRVINPYRLGGMRLAHTALKPTVMDFLDESLGSSGVDVELGEVPLFEKSEFVGQTLARSDVRRRFGIIVVALKRGDESRFNPEAHEILRAGDVMVVLGPVKSIAQLSQASSSS